MRDYSAPVHDAPAEERVGYQQKLVLLARVIEQLDSDVVGFQEDCRRSWIIPVNERGTLSPIMHR